MNNFTLGSYMPYDSLMHRMDPRAKIMGMIFFMVAIFIPAGYVPYLVLGVVALGLLLVSKLKIQSVWKSMKPMMIMMLFLFIINLLVVRTGFVVLNINGWKIYSDAISQTFYIVVRLVLMIMITTTLTATTKPLDLTLGIEDLLTPFHVIHVPAHEIAMMISIALRFIPTLIEETHRIMKAQASRGVDMEEGKLKEKIMAVLSLIVPLFVSAFQRAEDLANAMEARGYIPDRKRTRYKQLKMHARDWGLVLGSLILVALPIMINVFDITFLKIGG